MFFRKVTTKSGDKEYSYLKLIENYRDGNKVKQRVVANLGNIENMTPEKVQILISGLSKICGLDMPSPYFGLSTKSVLNLGEVAAVNKIWDNLNMNSVLNLPDGHNEKNPDFPLLVKLLVLNQTIKNHQRMPLNIWYRKLYLPEFRDRDVLEEDYNDTLRTLISVKESLENSLLRELKKQYLVNTETAYCHLLSGKMLSPNLNEGLNFLNHQPLRENVDLAIWTSSEGIPFRHHTFSGRFSDEKTIPNRISNLQEEFGIKKCIFISDQADIITEKNLQELKARGHEYILGVKITSSPETTAFVRDIPQHLSNFTAYSEDLLFLETKQDQARYLLCYSPNRAKRINEELEQELNMVEKELEKIKYDTASPSNQSKQKTAGVLRNQYCRKYFDYYYDDNGHFYFQRKHRVIETQKLLNGKMLLKTSSRLMPPEDIIRAYNMFTKLKLDFQKMRGFDRINRPNPGRELIGGQVQITFISYLFEQILNMTLCEKGIEMSAPVALEILEGLKVVVNEVGNSEISLVSPATEEQLRLLNAMGIDYEQLKNEIEESFLPPLAATSI